MTLSIDLLSQAQTETLTTFLYNLNVRKAKTLLEILGMPVEEIRSLDIALGMCSPLLNVLSNLFVVQMNSIDRFFSG